MRWNPSTNDGIAAEPGDHRPVARVLERHREKGEVRRMHDAVFLEERTSNWTHEIDLLAHCQLYPVLHARVSDDPLLPFCLACTQSSFEQHCESNRWLEIVLA